MTSDRFYYQPIVLMYDQRIGFSRFFKPNGLKISYYGQIFA